MKTDSKDEIELELDEHLEHHIQVEKYIEILNEMKKNNMDHMLDNAEVIVEAESFDENDVEGIEKCEKIYDVAGLILYKIHINPDSLDNLIKNDKIKSIEMSCYLETHI